jgi:hypothetical protein
MSQQLFDYKTLERLHNNADFLTLLDHVCDCREGHIRDMHGATSETIQQISGRILALDEFLALTSYPELKEKFRKLQG